MSLVDFPRRPWRIEPRQAAMPASCPLCGRPFRMVPERGCHLGHCDAAPDVGSPEAQRIERNREILLGDLVEAEISLLALETVTAAARARGVPVGGYLEQLFPLAMRKRILRGYFE